MNATSTLQELADRFIDAFDAAPTHAAEAPGRVNLIGEHTDYNDGFVLPMAIDRRVTILAHPRRDARVRLRTTLTNAEATFDLDRHLTPGEPAWANYVKGAVAGCVERGLNPGGFDALLHSTVPAGGGLSSSAALEVAAATIVESLTGRTLQPVEKALLAQHAEHTFTGVPCGIMDQFISVCGRAGHALLIDCRSHDTELVPLDDPAVSVLIIHSNVSHELAGGEYAKRRADCEKAANILGVRALRDATLDQLAAQRGRMDEVVFRRARHAVSEIARTLDAVKKLRARDYAAFGKLMYDSHASLRDDYEVSCDELDLLVELASPLPGVLGSRMTGGGFGGCTVTLVETARADAVRDAVCDAYQHRTHREPMAFLSRPANGARVLRVP